MGGIYGSRCSPIAVPRGPRGRTRSRRFAWRGAMGADGVELDVRRTGRRCAGGAPRPAPRRRPADRRRRRAPTCPTTCPTCERRSTRAPGCGSTSRSRTTRPSPTSTRPIRSPIATIAALLATRRRRPLADLVVPHRDRRSLPGAGAARSARRGWCVDGARRRHRRRWSAAVTRRCTRGSRTLTPSRTSTRCHGAGLEVNTWTCDDPARMAELIEWGIDGICTNVPDVALDVIARRLARSGRRRVRRASPRSGRARTRSSSVSPR